jgi:hypothetical protein
MFASKQGSRQASKNVSRIYRMEHSKKPSKPAGYIRIIIITRREVHCWNPLKQTIVGPRAGQRPFTDPI